MSKKIERVRFATLDPAGRSTARIDGTGQTARSAAVALAEDDTVAEVMILSSCRKVTFGGFQRRTLAETARPALPCRAITTRQIRD
jgi:hypothetical protein